MNKFSIKTSLISLVFGLTVSTQSMAAGIPVLDATNFLKTTISATEAVTQTAHQANLVAEAVNQYNFMFQNLKQLDPTVIAEGITRGFIPAGDYSSIGQLADAAKGVYGAYKNIGQTMGAMESTYKGMDNLMQDLNRTSIDSRVSPERILQYDFQRAQQGIQQDTNYYNHLKYLNNQLEQHQKRADQLATQIPDRDGTVGLLQTVGAQNALLQDQLTHLIQVSSISTEKAVDNSFEQRLKSEQEARDLAASNNLEKKAVRYFGN